MNENKIDAATGLTVLEMRPGEIRFLDMDCSRYLRAGDTIAGLVGPLIGVNQGKVAGSEEIGIASSSHDSDHTVQAKFTAVTDGEDYVITANITTVGGDTLAPQGLLRVRS